MEYFAASEAHVSEDVGRVQPLQSEIVYGRTGPGGGIKYPLASTANNKALRRVVIFIVIVKKLMGRKTARVECPTARNIAAQRYL